ncbi:MAG: hypothetical protein HY924_11015 [Elusimicrobia bacterium]|nr:hypothetical protein [Elusimicrobiota bacterium]
MSAPSAGKTDAGPRRAKEPFRFCSRLGLTVLTGAKARSVPELLEHLRSAPEAVIYQHTHRFLAQHQHLVPEPPNDFAYWATQILADERLGERLAAVDTVRCNSIAELRKALVSAIEAHLGTGAACHDVAEGKEFHFMAAVKFSLPTPYEAYDLAGFAEGLKSVSISSLYLHVFEARLRPPLGVNDFSHWFEAELHEKALAKQVADLDPYTHTMEGLRAKILGFVESRLKEASYGAA